jgi:hypothetical protein
MPLYPFVDTTTGQETEMFFAMSVVPSIGEEHRNEYGIFRRLPPRDMQIDVGVIRNMYPYLSQSLPRNLAGCDTNKQGKPIIMSRRHEANVAARHGYERDY